MKIPYSQPLLSTPAVASSAGGPTVLGREDRNLLSLYCLISLGLHAAVLGLALLIILIFQFLGWEIPLFSMHVKPREDTEYVLVDNSPTEKPRQPTRRRAAHASRSGGQKVAKQPTQMAQRIAGPATPRRATRAAAPSQARPQARPQPAQRQVAHRAQPRQQPKAQSQPQPKAQPKPQRQTAPTPHRTESTQQAQAPTPRPTPPAPKLPRPTRVANASPSLPPSPVAPTIRMPAPPNPAASSGGGRIFRTPGSSSGGGSSGAASGGNPGPSMIAGNPSRGGGGYAGGRSGQQGGGGGGGRGAYNQSGSPGGGGGRAGIDAMEEPDFGPYIAELQRRIRRNWAPPVEDRSKRVVAFFKIARDGRLLSLRLQQSSGSPPADQAALAAVRASAPFRQLPVNFRGNDIDVQFIFDYEIYGHGAAHMR